MYREVMRLVLDQQLFFASVLLRSLETWLCFVITEQESKQKMVTRLLILLYLLFYCSFPGKIFYSVLFSSSFSNEKS